MTQHAALPDITDEQVTWPAAVRSKALLLGGIGAALIMVVMLYSGLEPARFRHFLFSYLVSYCFFLSIALGALIFVLWHHAARAGWSVTVRRLAEILAATLPLLAVLFLPVLMPVLSGNSSLYPWRDSALLAADEALRNKAGWFSMGFFGGRCIVYFVIWAFLSRFFWLRSVQQDRSGLTVLTLRMERLSPVGLLLLAATITFAAFDFLMSLTPHWYSTIYGLYYFSGGMVGALAAIILLAIALQAAGLLRNLVTVEHYHDLGKLLFAFVIFWGYMAFSQYMLIWYANLPEETEWYRPRNSGAWGVMSLVLLFGHLFIPFLGMMSREIKRRKALLGFWAMWLLVVHWLDVYWLAMPALTPNRVPLGLMDLACLAGVGCLFVAGVIWVGTAAALVPVKDPRLAESLAFENI